jgi:predicted HTH transcriptional regulator
MLTKALAALTPHDFVGLVGTAESRYLDFKSAPVGGSPDDRREFLADVSAFANASGGDIVFGVTTADGAAAATPGIELANADDEKLRLGEMIRSGLEPRLTTFDLEWVPLAGLRGFLIVRVPRSWIAPHRVTFRGHDKFAVLSQPIRPPSCKALRRWSRTSYSSAPGASSASNVSSPRWTFRTTSTYAEIARIASAPRFRSSSQHVGQACPQNRIGRAFSSGGSA